MLMPIRINNIPLNKRSIWRMSSSGDSARQRRTVAVHCWVGVLVGAGASLGTLAFLLLLGLLVSLSWAWLVPRRALNNGCTIPPGVCFYLTFNYFGGMFPSFMLFPFILPFFSCLLNFSFYYLKSLISHNHVLESTYLIPNVPGCNGILLRTRISVSIRIPENPLLLIFRKITRIFV